MPKCKSCGKEVKHATMYEHIDGGYVCSECVGKYFTCPDCGRVFDMDDYENGDQSTGFCKNCSPEH